MSADDDQRGAPVMPGGEQVMTAADAESLDTLRRMWELRDPVPADLTERVRFVLAMEDLDAELMLLAEDLQLAGSRSEDRARSVTFSSEHLSVMVTITDDDPGVRLDGWVGDGAGIEVGLRCTDGAATDIRPTEDAATTTDEDGRFSFSGLTHGLVQLVFRPTSEATLALVRPVVTPAVQI